MGKKENRKQEKREKVKSNKRRTGEKDNLRSKEANEKVKRERGGKEKERGKEKMNTKEERHKRRKKEGKKEREQRNIDIQCKCTYTMNSGILHNFRLFCTSYLWTQMEYYNS